ncbi:helicase-associated domain-containing protein [Xylanimonas sp. McL0601]|uniref:helicase-associated domain-containing protein n=1 Tax=Xylanimonas sp. McL0601 TaxID=3414739 RepID=UPI003CF15214
MASFSDAVRELPDDALVVLLRARPDLASPSPSTLRSLAARASSRTSLDRALAQADTPTIQALEAVLALEGVLPAVRPADVAAAVGATSPDDVAAVEQLLAAALAQALLWAEAPDLSAPESTQPPRGPDSRLHAAPGLIEVLGPYPAGLGPLRGRAVDPEELDAVDAPGAREVLDALAWGPPVGTVPPAGTPARAAVDALLTAGLLATGDGTTVAPPREVGLALRGGRTHREPHLAPPAPAGARPVTPATADAEAASAAVEAVRLVDALLRTWEDAPPPVLRAGGLGVRDLHRTGQALGVDDAMAASVVELAASAGLVDDDGDAPPSYVPTTRADAWDDADTADRWGMLAAAWTGSRRTPWLAGTRDEKGVARAPLSTDLSRGWVPRLRAQVLAALAALPGVSVRPADVSADLAWRSPRAVPPEAAVAGLLREAALLGVTGAGALAATGRALRALVESGDAPDAEAVLAETLRGVLPESVDEVLLQGDLTGIVPGRPSRQLAALIERAADVESRGAATTVRFTPSSVIRALDAGTTAEELLDELARRSPVPVPQPLAYLVRDTARRHAALRVGAAGSYLRATDPAALAGLVEDPRLAELGLVRLAPTVIAAAVPAAALQAVLRQRGLLAALEGPDGRPLGRLRRPPRVDRGGARGVRSPYAAAGAPTSDAGRRALVERLRVADGEGRRSPFASTAAGESGVAISALGRTPPSDALLYPGSLDAGRRFAPSDLAPAEATSGVAAGTAAPGDALALLRDAVRDGGHVWLELVDGHGRPVRRRVRPLRVEAGRLRALDTQRGAELTVAVHRIARVDPDDD